MNFKKPLKFIFRKAGKKLVNNFSLLYDVRQLSLSNYLFLQYKKISNIEGNIVEFGVGKGRSFLFLSSFVYLSGDNREVWGFDSFEGFPDPSEYDMGERNPKIGEWSGTSISDVSSVLKVAGLSEKWIKNNTVFIKGFFEDTVEKYSGEKIALLHIDVDLYDSYKVVLENMFDFVVPGGLVLFDEYNEDKWPGAKKAIDEFVSKKNFKLEQDKFSKKFFIQK